MKYNMNNDWYFTEHYSANLLQITEEDMQKMEKVRIPHTVKELSFNYCNEKDYQMESGYVRRLFAESEWKGKKVFLHFGAAAHEAEVYCNGVSVMTHSCGYTAFTVDLTNHLKYGETNLITVRLDSRESLNIPPFGQVVDYLTFGGLYRSISLEVKDASHIEDVFVYGGLDKMMHVKVAGVETEDCMLTMEVTNVTKRKLSIEVAFPKEKTVLLQSKKPFVYKEEFQYSVPEAKIWDLQHPNLYQLTLHLWKNHKEIDQKTVRFGFRTVTFTKEGFYLNGKKIKLRGLNRHQSYPYVGYAMPDRAQVFDADILKNELGCNAVRTSHYPQSHAFYDRCDEIGLLVFTEIPGWQHIGDVSWKKQAIRNTEEMVKQYRNHPSIFIWGVRINESPDDDEFYQKTNEVAHQLDATRPTGGVRCIKKSHLLEDVYTYNDFYNNGFTKGCEPKKNVTSDMNKGYLISEHNGHMFPTKSFDWEEKRRDHALRHAETIDETRAQKEIAGCFGWCMFDYNTHQDFGSGDRICYHGVMDMFRNPKMAAAVYAAEGAKRPVLEISSSMDIGEHPSGSLGEVYAFTNGDEVELYKNGAFVAKFVPGKAFPHMKHSPILIDDVIGCLLEKGEGYSPRVASQIKEVLYAIAKNGQAAIPLRTMLTGGKLMLANGFTYQKGEKLYGKYIGNWGGKMTQWQFVAKKDGKKIAECYKGAVTSTHLEVKADTKQLVEDETYDVATIRIRALDQNDNVLPYMNNVVTLKTEGNIELIGPSEVSLQGGMTGTYVKTVGKDGDGKLIISASGMNAVECIFKTEVITENSIEAATENVTEATIQAATEVSKEV